MPELEFFLQYAQIGVVQTPYATNYAALTQQVSDNQSFILVKLPMHNINCVGTLISFILTIDIIQIETVFCKRNVRSQCSAIDLTSILNQQNITCIICKGTFWFVVV